jgi:hypothetical protein
MHRERFQRSLPSAIIFIAQISVTDAAGSH